MTRSDRARNLLRAAHYEPPFPPERRCRQCWEWTDNPDAVCDACAEPICECNQAVCICGDLSEQMRRDNPTY